MSKDIIKEAMQEWVDQQSPSTLQEAVTNLQQLRRTMSEQTTNLTIKAKLQENVKALRSEFRTMLTECGCSEQAIEDYMGGMLTTTEVINYYTTSPTMELYRVGLDLTEQQNGLETYTYLSN